MKVKPPKKTTTVELENWEVDRLVKSLESVLSLSFRGTGILYPLPLADLLKALKEAK